MRSINIIITEVSSVISFNDTLLLGINVVCIIHFVLKLFEYFFANWFQMHLIYELSLNNTAILCTVAGM